MSPGSLRLGNRVQDGGNSSVAEFQRAGGHLRVQGSGGMLRLANYTFQSSTGVKAQTMVPANGHPLICGIQESTWSTSSGSLPHIHDACIISNSHRQYFEAFHPTQVQAYCILYMYKQRMYNMRPNASPESRSWN